MPHERETGRDVSDDELLRVESLVTEFHMPGRVVRAVDGASWSLRRGQTLALVGESGCGKSVTALSIMRLLDAPGRIVDGRIVFDGRNLLDLPERRMRQVRGNRIAMIFQEPMTSLNPVFACGRQVVEAIELHQKIRGRAAWNLAEEMFARVGIPDPGRRVRDYPHQMSGGMRQRVMIAMALSCNPSLLIADEPTTALDVTIQAQILDLLGKLQAETGMSILLITHDLGIVARSAHEVCVMYAGRVVERAPVRGLFERPLHPYTQGLLRCVPRLSQRKRRLEVIDDSVHAYCARAAALEEAAPGHWVARPIDIRDAEPSAAAEGVVR
jgi:peptide/nickel transport system ATP-binding protein